jgi:hypothetical protein
MICLQSIEASWLMTMSGRLGISEATWKVPAQPDHEKSRMTTPQWAETGTDHGEENRVEPGEFLTDVKLGEATAFARGLEVISCDKR